ncbi:hypothetical protein GWI33_015558 [Rhynchophorus ferrugineus]|uniref:Uncharacterized protein n=1 Tax=Rhynchophorus ferrugineus TaxID=354439 RepID=A0A834ID05_RHYFE|nr:hypothetical protein GWI33_015558 [Rhynchophorus ferrugineus]
MVEAIVESSSNSGDFYEGVLLPINILEDATRVGEVPQIVKNETVRIDVGELSFRPVIPADLSSREPVLPRYFHIRASHLSADALRSPIIPLFPSTNRNSQPHRQHSDPISPPPSLHEQQPSTAPPQARTGATDA